MKKKITINFSKIVNITISMLVVLVFGISTLIFTGKVISGNTQINTPAEMRNLSGDKAIDRLKQDGSYESLAEAVTAARYAVDKEKTGASADNPAHDWQINFTPDGMQLSSTNKENSWTSNWHLSSFGYGENQTAAAKGDVQTNGNRVELKRESQNLTEWFVNETNGVEHGFTLANRPPAESNDAALRLVMKVDGDLTARADIDGQMLTLLNKDGEKILRYEKLKVWDANGKDLTARMRTVEKVGEVWLEVEDELAVYPLTIDPTFVGEIKITASDGAANQAFGLSVGINGETAIVGAAAANSGQGAAYIFVRNGNGWTQQQKLTASDGENNDFLGRSVAVSGDTAIVGASGDDLATGSAYVFVRNGTSWTQQQKLTASDADEGSFYGWSVGIEGNTAVVGAYNGNSTDGEPNGAAYIYFRSGTTWNQQQKLLTLDGEEGRFGESVGISGETVIVSSQYSDVGGNESQGAAYIYVRNGTVWSQQQKIVASDGTDSDAFGNSVGISGDTVIVGNVSRNAGSAAYVFVRSGTSWTQQQILTPSGGGSFGGKVAISGDSAFVANSGSQESVYYFARSGTSWSEEQIIVASDGVPNDYFGSGLAVNETTLIIGAFGDNSNRGAAYIYSMPTITVNITTDESDPTPADGICDVDPGTNGFQCSLRAAIETANANKGSDSIEFNIPGGGIQTISPTSALPAITGAASINATTQPGYTNSPLIELRGDMAGSSNGLVFSSGSDNSTVSGLTINRFQQAGIVFQSGNNRLEKSWIGLFADGTTVDASGRQTIGISITGGNNKIGVGRTGSAADNLITGNSLSQISISSSQAVDNVVAANDIGFDKNGNVPTGTFLYGIRISQNAARNKIGGTAAGEANLIKIPEHIGILIEGNSNENTVTRNTISGCDVGVRIIASSNNTIGGAIGNTETSSRNGIGDNGIGIYIGDLSFSPNSTSSRLKNISTRNESKRLAKTSVGGVLTQDNKVYGNLIGIAPNIVQFDNDYGIVITNAERTLIGSGASDTQNFISSNIFEGVVLDKQSVSNIVQGNFIGTDLSGINISPNRNGIQIAGSNNQIINNVISGNNDYGVMIQTLFDGDPIPTGNSISNNQIGIGTNNLALPNDDGILLNGTQNSVASNIISGNNNYGIDVRRDQNNISNNKIGTNSAGDAAVGNGQAGIIISSSTNTIKTNVMSGNFAGIAIVQSSATPTMIPDANIIQGNFIGTNANGTVAIPNSNAGILISGANNTLIGGFTPVARNIISGNGKEGISLLDGATLNRISGNYIGTKVDGISPLGNMKDGIRLGNGVNRTIIGGTEANSGNIIAFNGVNGVTLAPNAGNGNLIDPNSIFGNAGISIDIGEDGFTPNDLHDADVGPNNLQNYPEFGAVQINSSGDLVVSFIVDSAPENSVYGTNGIRAEFFKADNSGQGERFLGFASYTVADYNNGSPNLRIVNLGNAAALGFNTGDLLTATATDADGNSSEFTPAFTSTAAFVTVSGRVYTAENNGLSRVFVVMTNSNGTQRTAQANSFGLYRFGNVQAGMTYTFQVISKEYTFAPQTVNVEDNLTNLNFTAQPESGQKSQR